VWPNPLLICDRNVYLILDITASITYNPYAPIIDLGFVSAYHDVNDTALVPVVVEPMLRKTQTMDLEVSFGTVSDGTNRGMFNGIYYVQPELPSDLRVFQLGPNATDSSAYGNASFVIPHLTELEIVVKNGDNGGHPLYVKLLSVHCIVVLTVGRITAISTVTRCKLWAGRRITLLPTRFLTHPLSKARQIQYVVTRSRCQLELPSRCV
jgi:hypothetical protein